MLVIMGDTRNAYKILVPKTEGKRLHGKLLGVDGNVAKEMGIRETGCEDVD
jgi:hypothetical protein